MGNIRLTAVLTFPRSQSCSVGDTGCTRPGTVVFLGNKRSLMIARKTPRGRGNMAIYSELGLFLAKSRVYLFWARGRNSHSHHLCLRWLRWSQSNFKSLRFMLTIPLCPYFSHQSQMGSVAIRQWRKPAEIANCLIERSMRFYRKLLKLHRVCCCLLWPAGPHQLLM